MIFDKRQSNIVKGIAVLLLIFHHLFFNNPDLYGQYFSIFQIGGVPLVAKISEICKVCVYIFLFISGYGLFLTYTSKISNAEKRGFKVNIKFVLNRLFKVMLPFCFIYIIFVPLGFFLGRNPVSVYNGNAFFAILDFLGLAQVFSTPTMNSTWWYMSVIIIFYVLFPIILKLISKSKILCWIWLVLSFILIVLPGSFSKVPIILLVKLYFAPFYFGIFVAKFNLLNRLSEAINSKGKFIVLSVVLTVITGALSYFNLFLFSTLFAFSIILLSYAVFGKNKDIAQSEKRNIFAYLGIHSGNIFMFHTFIYMYYLHDLIYSCKYPILIFLVTVVICLVISILLEQLKKLIRYNKIGKLISLKY